MAEKTPEERRKEREEKFGQVEEQTAEDKNRRSQNNSNSRRGSSQRVGGRERSFSERWSENTREVMTNVYVSWDNVVVDVVPRLFQFLAEEASIKEYETEEELRKALLNDTFDDKSISRTAFAEYLRNHPPALFEGALDIIRKLSELKGYRLYAVNILQDRYQKEWPKDDDKLWYSVSSRLQLEDASESREVIFVTSSLRECRDVYCDYNGVKVMSVSNIPEYIPEDLEHTSIVCRSLADVEEYLTTPCERTERRLKYVITGFSTDLPKFYLHKKLRGWSIVNKPQEARFVHLLRQERNKELRHDPAWYNVRCTVKDQLLERELKLVTDKMNLSKCLSSVEPPILPPTRPLSEVEDVEEPLIIKPATARCGLGISIATTKEELAAAKDLIQNNFKCPGIASRYIINPLLFHGKKCHFRCYLLIVVRSPREKIFKIFHRRRIYHAYEPYQAGDWANKRIHDTHMSSTDTEFFFPEDFPNPEDKPWHEEKISAGIEMVRKHLEDVLKPVIKTYKESDYGYHILGPDILFDEDYKPYLLEVNMRPTAGPIKGVTEKFRIFQREFADWEYENGVEPFITIGGKKKHNRDDEGHVAKKQKT